MIHRVINRIIILSIFGISCLLSGIPHHFLKSGLDNSFGHGLDEFKNLNIAVFCNHSSLDSYGRHILDIMKTNESIRIQKAYVFRREEWESYWHSDLLLKMTDHFVDFRFELDDEFSVSDFQNVEKIVFDMQHTGFLGDPVITYLRIAMRIANRLDKPLIVIDRPIFYDRNQIFGPVNDRFGNLPLQYGLTLAELAKYFSKLGLLKNSLLEIIPMEDWEYAENIEEYEYLWQNQSSNLESSWDCKFFPLSQLLDTSTLEWEKDSILNKYVIYASWLDATFLLEAISEEYPEFRKLGYSIIQKDSVDMKSITLNSLINFSNYEVVLTIMRTARILYPKEFYVKPAYSMRLFESSKFADMINTGKEISYIFHYWIPEQNDFFKKRDEINIYSYFDEY